MSYLIIDNMCSDLNAVFRIRLIATKYNECLFVCLVI